MGPNRGPRSVWMRALGPALLLWLLGLAGSGMGPALAQVSPLTNAGFETGDLSGWRTYCTDAAAGGCDTWSISVGPEERRVSVSAVWIRWQLAHLSGVASEPVATCGPPSASATLPRP